MAKLGRTTESTNYGINKVTSAQKSQKLLLLSCQTLLLLTLGALADPLKTHVSRRSGPTGILRFCTNFCISCGGLSAPLHATERDKQMVDLRIPATTCHPARKNAMSSTAAWQ